MVRKIVVTSGKGGVGKTTLVCGLGVTLARMGYKTLLIDMDFGLNNLDVIMGVENKIVYDIIDVLEGKCLPKQAIIQDFQEENLYIFPSTHSYCKVRFGSRELLQIISKVEDNFDFVLIDCPAGIDGGFRRAVGSGDEFIVVTTPHLSAVRDGDKVINCLSTIRKPYLIINRARGDLILDAKMLSIDAIKNSLNAELIGVIPEDDCVTIQSLEGDFFESNSMIQKSLNMIANYLTKKELNIYDCTEKYKGLFGGIKKKLRGRV